MSHEPTPKNTPAAGDSETGADRLFFHADLVAEFQDSCAPRQRALLSLLAISQKYDLDPAPLISGLANDLPRTPLESRRRTRSFFWSRVEQMATDVEASGAGNDTKSILSVLKRFPRLLPGNVELALRLENQKQRLPRLFQSWLNRPPSYDKLQRAPLLMGALTRGLFLLFFLVTVVSFIMLKVVPELKSMLSEFAIKPPFMFTLSIEVADFLVRYWFVLALCLLIGMFLCIPAIRSYLRRWNPFIWRQPDLPSAVRTRRALAMVTEHGKEKILPSTFVGLKQIRRDVGVDNKQGAIAGTGQLEWDRLSSQGKISAQDLKALKGSSSKITQAWILRKSADSRLKSNENREWLIAKLVLAGINILLGISVFILATGLFSVLITIMEELG